MQVLRIPSSTRWLVLGVALLVALALAGLAARVWLADHRAHSANPEDWLRAAETEPGNAAYWYDLARFRQLDLARADLQKAIAYYRRATEIDPRSAFYWMDLADTYEMAGQGPLARQAFEKAKDNYPSSSEVAWRYGNFLLRQGELPRAFSEIRRAISSDPSRAPLAVGICWRASRDVDRILNEVLPAETNARLRALDALVAEHETVPALAVWKRLLGRGENLELRRAFPLVDELLAQGQVAEAKQVWQQALRAAGWLASQTAEPPLVTDGGFERDLPGGGFGWRLQPLAGATAEMDAATHHSGARSLRITFDGSANLNYAHLAQSVAVEPRTRYRFAAQLRTEGISTDSGVRFGIADPLHAGAVGVLTENLAGDHPWTLQQAEFTTGPETQLVEVTLLRLPSQRFDNKLRGTVWIDDVSLSPVTPAGRTRR